MDGEGKSAAVHRDEASAGYSAKISVIWISVPLFYTLKELSETSNTYVL